MQPISSYPAATLVLFCRRPALGNGKQRLARSLGETASLAIAEALLECALEDAAAWPGVVVISPSSADDAAWAAALTGDPERVLTQGEGNLGRRLNRVDASLRRRGCERVLFIGSDAPSLRPGDLRAAAQSLGDADVVLVPAEDGGVTLMGSRVAWPDLTGLPWSQSTLGAALEQRCREARLSVVRLPGSYDVDEAADLPAAIAALSSDDRPARARLRELLVAVLRSSSSGPDGAGGGRQDGGVRLRALLALVIFVLLAVAAVALPARMWLREALAWTGAHREVSALAYFAIYVLATVCLVPGLLLTLAGGALFGLLGGTALVSASSVAGATTAFLAGRILARDWV
ncbi:MAG: DUF2064 domain-containing protein, partial [Steroidobacteraceae bacterium]